MKGRNMDTKDTILGNIGGILLAAAVIFALWMLLPRLDQYLRIMAVTDCSKISKYETRPDGNTVVTYPMSEFYKACLKDKGY